LKQFSKSDEGYEKMRASHKAMVDIATRVNKAVAYKSNVIQLDSLQSNIKSGWISKDVSYLLNLVLNCVK